MGLVVQNENNVCYVTVKPTDVRRVNKSMGFENATATQEVTMYFM